MDVPSPHKLTYTQDCLKENKLQTRMMEEGDAIERKLQEIASRLQHAAVSAQEGHGGDGPSTSEPIASPLKVTVAKPFKEDYQGFFVLTLTYHPKARHLDADLVLSYAGVDGSTLKAQVWSGCTFQLLIPKYESSDSDNNACGGGDHCYGGLWSSPFFNIGSGRRVKGCNRGYYRAKEELILTCIRLGFGLFIIQAVSLFIKHGDGDAYTLHELRDPIGTGESTTNANDGLVPQIVTTIAWSAALLRQTVRRVVMNTWVVSL